MILKEEGEISFKFEFRNVLGSIGHTPKISVPKGYHNNSKQMLRILVDVNFCDPSLYYFILI